ncbi:hypothetical protein AALT_g11815 [Alternaria alternata]|nr:hypothetical protein AALT_g11815 [Alternaria alternata]
MANKKYKDPADAKEARRTCNRLAQQKYRRKLKELKRAAQPSPSDGTSQSEMNEEALTATVPPDASVHEASNEVDSVEDERRRPDAASAPLTPLEHIASIEQSIDALLASLNDPCVQKSLQGPIKRIDSKFRDFVHRVEKTDKTPVRRDARIVSSTQYDPHKWNTASSIPWGITADTTQSFPQQAYGYGAQCAPSMQIKLLRTQLESAMQHMLVRC